MERLNLRIEVQACSEAEECLSACHQGKAIRTTPEVLRQIADRIPRDCVVIVEVGDQLEPA